MHPSAWAYYSAGAGDEVTLRWEREAFDRLRLVPRVLRGVDRADTSTAVLGTPVQAPIMFAPTGVQGLAHPEGECATARGAGEAGTLMAVSTVSSRRLEDVSAATVGPLWFQLYVHEDARHFAGALVRRAEGAGYGAIVLTVDSPGGAGRNASRASRTDCPRRRRGQHRGRSGRGGPRARRAYVGGCGVAPVSDRAARGPERHTPSRGRGARGRARRPRHRGLDPRRAPARRRSGQRGGAAGHRGGDRGTRRGLPGWRRSPRDRRPQGARAGSAGRLRGPTRALGSSPWTVPRARGGS